MTHADTLDLSDAIETDDVIANVTIDHVFDRIEAALRYSQDIHKTGANPEYWRGRVDAFYYALSEIRGVVS